MSFTLLILSLLSPCCSPVLKNVESLALRFGVYIMQGANHSMCSSNRQAMTSLSNRTDWSGLASAMHTQMPSGNGAFQRWC